MRKLSELSEDQPSRSRTLRQAWAKLWETDPPVFVLRLATDAPPPKVRRFVPAFLTSALLHSSIVFFLYSIPFALLLAWFMGPPPRKTASSRTLVFEFSHLTLPYLPRLTPPGRGKAPGRGAKPRVRPRLGSTHLDPRITIISNPPNPDNSRMTFKSEISPPNLKLPLNIKIPDLISGGPAPKPEPPKSPTPAQKPQIPVVPKPSPAAPPALTMPKVATPKPFVPLPPAPALVPKGAPPKLSAPPPPPPTLQLAMQLPDIPAPRLEVPPPPPPVKSASVPQASPGPSSPEGQPAAPQSASAQGQGTANSSTAASPSGKSGSVAGDTSTQGGGPKVLSLSVEPIPLTDHWQIPAGERTGAFSIGPNGKAEGSPGGVPGGENDVGEGGHGPGGDKSVAVGNGNKGTPGGGGGSGAGNSLNPGASVIGPAGVSGIAAGTLPPLNPESLVYPVKPETPKAHAPAIVVSSGFGGGGGLRIYGVLHSRKIYTVYFSMPGKSWILQYCARENGAGVDSTSRAVQLTIQPPLLPPAAVQEFDFHRPAGQDVDSANNMIVLHGVIHEDGSVTDLNVMQGADPLTNAAACAAFGRWKFQPSLRAGAPVALEVLLGIPE